MANLYNEKGDPQQAVQALTSIPSTDRSPRINFALGASYDQLHQTKLAIAAYSPPLDKAGNSVRAQAAITQIAHTLELGLFNT